MTALCRRSQSHRGLRRGSAVARLLILRVRIPSAAWMSASCECCVLSGKVCVGAILSGKVCVGAITGPEESYLVWCVWSQRYAGPGLLGGVEPWKIKRVNDLVTHPRVPTWPNASFCSRTWTGLYSAGYWCHSGTERCAEPAPLGPPLSGADWACRNWRKRTSSLWSKRCHSLAERFL